MTISDHSVLLAQEPYQRQMTSYRRTRSAILEGAKTLLALQGFQRANMVDIADTAEVSRATLYNHFRDKPSVMRALLESEVERLLQIIESDIPTVEALTRISAEISSDVAIATLRSTDAGVLMALLTYMEDPLWEKIRAALFQLVGDVVTVEIVQRWLVAQFLQPLIPAQSLEQAKRLLTVEN